MLKYELVVRKILCQILDLENIEDISNTEDLKAIGMDSLNCMELIVAIEDTFTIAIPDEKLGIRFVHNIYDICKLIEEVESNEQLQAV